MQPCAQCHRHVRATETTCPFCQAPLATSPSMARASAAAIAAGLMLLACPDPDDPGDEWSGADYGGAPPPCDALDTAIEVSVGANAINLASASDDFTSSCDDQPGNGPDQIVTFIAPAAGTYSFALDVDGWLVNFGEYDCSPYDFGACVPNQALSIELTENGYVSLLVDTPEAGANATLTVTQE